MIYCCSASVFYNYILTAVQLHVSNHATLFEPKTMSCLYIPLFLTIEMPLNYSHLHIHIKFLFLQFLQYLFWLWLFCFGFCRNTLLALTNKPLAYFCSLLKIHFDLKWLTGPVGLKDSGHRRFCFGETYVPSDCTNSDVCHFGFFWCSRKRLQEPNVFKKSNVFGDVQNSE